MNDSCLGEKEKLSWSCLKDANNWINEETDMKKNLFQNSGQYLEHSRPLVHVFNRNTQINENSEYISISYITFTSV